MPARDAAPSGTRPGSSPPDGLRPGAVVRVDGDASVQFGDDRAITFRIIKLYEDGITYDGWLWMSGYQLNSAGEAVERRNIFVRQAGLRLVNPSGKPRLSPPRTR